jgi:hypothetical protein
MNSKSSSILCNLAFSIVSRFGDDVTPNLHRPLLCEDDSENDWFLLSTELLL